MHDWALFTAFQTGQILTCTSRFLSVAAQLRHRPHALGAQPTADNHHEDAKPGDLNLQGGRHREKVSGFPRGRTFRVSADLGKEDPFITAVVFTVLVISGVSAPGDAHAGWLKLRRVPRPLSSGRYIPEKKSHS